MKDHWHFLSKFDFMMGMWVNVENWVMLPTY